MTLHDAAKLLVERLQSHARRLVLAESCTGGLVAASLAAVPGVSQRFCGSAVTYREATKQAWLGIDREAIRAATAVSETVTRAMARGVLRRTAEADVAAAVTGHLGPDAPEPLDGILFVAFARRADSGIETTIERHDLVTIGRENRQREAAEFVLRFAARHVSRE